MKVLTPASRWGMTQLSRYVTLILCLVLAIVCYAVGTAKGFIFFLLLGFLFEVAFWMGWITVKK